MEEGQEGEGEEGEGEEGEGEGLSKNPGIYQHNSVSNISYPAGTHPDNLNVLPLHCQVQGSL